MASAVKEHGVFDLARYVALLDAVEDLPLCLIATDGRVIGWNRAAEQLSGFAAADLLGKPYPAVGIDIGASRAKFRQALEGGLVEFVATCRRASGGSFLAHCALIRLVHDGETVALIESLRDASLSAEAPLLYRENEQQLRTLIQGVTDYAIYMLDPNGNVSNWNSGGQLIKGYAADEVIGKHFSIFYTPEDRQSGEPKRALATALEHGKYAKEGWRVRKDGTRFWASVVIDPIRNEQGQLVGFGKVTRDLSELRAHNEALDAARAALHQSQKMETVGQLTGGVAHDFNNLLSVVTTSLELMLLPGVDEAHRRTLIETALRASDRGARLTQQLLAFSKQQPLKPERENIASLVIGIETMLRRACGETIELFLELDTSLSDVDIDAAQFESSLLNLVVNARDAIEQNGSIRIRTSRVVVAEGKDMAGSPVKAGVHIAVSVEDNGSGMSPTTRSRALEPFFTTKEVGKGSGLGLSQVYGFCAQSGGHLDIESELGVGTVITMYIPAIDAHEHDAAARVPQRVVLLVEDDADVMDTTAAALRLFGFDVLSARDGVSALAALKRSRAIDLLLSDIVMPNGINGIELAEQARELRPQLKVILTSGYAQSALKQGDLESRGFRFLRKPCRLADLQAMLQDVLA